MNSINSNLSAQYTRTDSPGAALVTGNQDSPNAAVTAEPADKAELGQSAADQKTEAAETKKGSKLKAMAVKAKATIDEAQKSPITFIKDHKKSVPMTIGALALGAAVIGTTVLDDDQVDDVKDIAGHAIQGGGVKKKIELFSEIAKFTGISATIACVIGGAVVAIEGCCKAVKGVMNVAKGAKKKDGTKAAKGVRSALAGVRKAMTGAVVGTLNAGGVLGTAAQVTKSVIMPPLRKVAAGLNIGIGAKTLISGIKKRDKSEILTGALDLGYGTAVGASILVGGPVTAAIAGTLLTAKEGLCFAKKVKKYKDIDTKIQAARALEAKSAQATPGSAKAEQAAEPAKVTEAHRSESSALIDKA